MYWMVNSCRGLSLSLMWLQSDGCTCSVAVLSVQPARISVPPSAGSGLRVAWGHLPTAGCSTGTIISALRKRAQHPPRDPTLVRPSFSVFCVSTNGIFIFTVTHLETMECVLVFLFSFGDFFCLSLLILPPECFLFNPLLAPGCCCHAVLGCYREHRIALPTQFLPLQPNICKAWCC